MDRLAQARALVAAGLSLVPIRTASKAPAVPWTDLQKRAPTDQELEDWIPQYSGLGIVCGAVSGNLEVLDLEAAAPLQEFRYLVEKQSPRLLNRLPRVQTPTGGRHILYRCDVIEGNQKLAADPSGKTLIETRGQGGQVLSPLCLPDTHPSGKPYQLLAGDLTQVPTITADEREILFNAARSLNEFIQPENARGYREARLGNGTKPGEDYDSRADASERVRELLREHGWVIFGKSRYGDLWSRPGVKDHSSATLFDNGCLYVFSSNALPFKSNEAYSPFAVYAELKHSGDFKAAAKDLGGLGFGEPSNGHKPSNYIEAESMPWPELDPIVLHGLAGEIVRAIEPHSEADRVALLMQTIVAFGNCVGRSPYFPVEGDRHHLNLSIVIVGATSKARKGTSWGQVRRLFTAVDEVWMRDCVQVGLSTGEGLIWAVRDPIEKKEPIKEKGRVTEYQTVIVDHGVDDKRLFVQEPEFAKVLRVMAREGNTLSAVIRQAWDTGDLRILTKTSPARATDAHVTICGHITGEELRRNLDETESANGFANRILWVQVRRSKFLPEGGNLKDSDLNSLNSRLSAAIQTARKCSELTRDSEARKLWCEVYRELSAGHSGLFGAITSRGEAQVLRLSCLYALLDESEVIKRPHLEAALALWRYCEDSARFIFGQATGDRTADAIVSALSEAGDEGLTKTQLSDVFSRKKDAAEINRALTLLQQQGLVASLEEHTQGRSRQRHFLTSPTAKKAKEGKRERQHLRGFPYFP